MNVTIRHYVLDKESNRWTLETLSGEWGTINSFQNTVDINGETINIYLIESGETEDRELQWDPEKCQWARKFKRWIA